MKKGELAGFAIRDASTGAGGRHRRIFRPASRLRRRLPHEFPRLLDAGDRDAVLLAQQSVVGLRDGAQAGSQETGCKGLQKWRHAPIIEDGA